MRSSKKKLIRKYRKSLVDEIASELGVGLEEEDACLTKAVGWERDGMEGMGEVLDMIRKRAAAMELRTELQNVLEEAPNAAKVEVSVNFVLHGHPKTADELVEMVREGSPELLDDRGEDEIRKACEEMAAKQHFVDSGQYNIYNIELPANVAVGIAKILQEHIPVPGTKHIADQLRAFATSLEESG
jgi:hypothetical protein